MTGYGYIVLEYVKNEIDFIAKLISKLDGDLKKCNSQLTAVKLKVTALQLQTTAMTKLYQDIMEIRRILAILKPHLKK